MGSLNKKQLLGSISSAKSIAQNVSWNCLKSLLKFLKEYKIGLSVILFCTLFFFAPLMSHLGTYSEGGDAMFNAWTLSRDHHCLLGQGCQTYSDGNIYFPNKDTMLYSETQLSAGLLTLPLDLIDQNPIFANNVLTIFSFFMTGLGMYLLARYLSKGNEALSILAGLVFEFSPLKMAAVWHLQNLSIFCLPFAVLFVLKYIDTKKRRNLALLFISLLYVFYASWYQMFFVLFSVGLLVLFLLLLRYAKLKVGLTILLVMFAALLATAPVAKEYMRFSKENKATFSVNDQVTYSSSLVDYVTPYDGTLLGKILYANSPDHQKNSFNLDSFSYHGLVLYTISAITIGIVFWNRKKHRVIKRQAIAFGLLGVSGFVISLGPLLKVAGSHLYHFGGLLLAVPLPWLLIDKFLPQLSFIRAIGRSSIITLFALCCILALFALLIKGYQKTNRKMYIGVHVLIIAFAIFELMPLYQVKMTNKSYAYNLEVPAVYKFVKQHDEINNLIVLQAKEYEGATFWFSRAETVLWSGYHNKNIFNGYSGYTPPRYFEDYSDFVNFDKYDISKMKNIGIRYVVVDNQLMDNKPEALANIHNLLGPKRVYRDNRYDIFKLN